MPCMLVKYMGIDRCFLNVSFLFFFIVGNLLQSLLNDFEENLSEEPSEPIPGSSKNSSYKINQDELD